MVKKRNAVELTRIDGAISFGIVQHRDDRFNDVNQRLLIVRFGHVQQIDAKATCKRRKASNSFESSRTHRFCSHSDGAVELSGRPTVVSPDTWLELGSRWVELDFETA